jgi:hypothetical protein
MRMKMLVIVALLLLPTLLPTAAQQPEAPPRIIYACIEQAAVDGAAPGSYLVGIRQPDLFGLTFSEPSSVTLYSPANYPLAAGVYNIAPDAATGGYRRTGEIATLYNLPNIPSPRPCSASYPSLLTQAFMPSITFPMSSNQGVIVQGGGDSQLDNAPVIGVIGLYFPVQAGIGLDNMQILQLTGTNIEITFPYLLENTDFALVANKNVTVMRSFPGSDFIMHKLSIPRSDFIIELANMTTPLNLFQNIMYPSEFRMYPAFGTTATYPANGVIRLDVSDSAVEREPEFTAGQVIGPIADLTVDYYFASAERANDGPLGSLKPGINGTVVNVDDTGRLIIKSPNNQEVIIPAWLVEVVN